MKNYNKDLKLYKDSCFIKKHQDADLKSLLKKIKNLIRKFNNELNIAVRKHPRFAKVLTKIIEKLAGLYGFIIGGKIGWFGVGAVWETVANCKRMLEKSKADVPWSSVGEMYVNALEYSLKALLSIIVGTKAALLREKAEKAIKRS